MPKWHLAVAASKGVIIAPELGVKGESRCMAPKTGAWGEGESVVSLRKCRQLEDRLD